MVEHDENELDVEEITSEIEDAKTDTATYKIRLFGADYTLEILSLMIGSGDIHIPPFQRDFVWKMDRSSKLIESFLLGLPVPQIFLFKEEETEKYLVVDGQQRLRSISLFFSEKWEDGSAFYLRNVRPEWEGKKFSDLTEAEKRRLKNTVMRATIFEQVEPEDGSSSMAQIFERLNSGGVILSQQEIRNCIYYGEFTEMIKGLNTDHFWRGILNKKYVDKNMKDMEMIVRFFALYDGWETYEKPMKKYLDTWMASKKNARTEDIEKYRVLFTEVITFIQKELGDKAFRLKRTINIPVFDAVCVAVARNGSISNFKEKYALLIKDEAFQSYVEKATTDPERVKGRIKIAMRVLSA